MNIPGQNKLSHPFCVAVYWPKDGEYGCVERFRTREEAEKEFEFKKRNWANEPKAQPHMWEEFPRKMLAV
jgi:hypothetical protein